MSTQRIPLWDLPIRLFHWLLAAAIAAAVITANIGGNAMVWHGRIGLFIAGLIVFRLVWGLIGPTYARFSTFLPTPGSIGAYLRGQWRGIFALCADRNHLKRHHRQDGAPAGPDRPLGVGLESALQLRDCPGNCELRRVSRFWRPGLDASPGNRFRDQH